MLSLRRATAIAFSSGVSSLYFYPRSPCGERLLLDRVLHGFDLISIHALLAESDMLVHDPDHPLVNFYPRSPCGERRDVIAVMTEAQSISIHALLAESDRHWQTGHSLTRQFLSTLSLRRATRALWGLMCCTSVFLSTLSLRRATHIGRGCGMIHRISIHALLAESDAINALGAQIKTIFLSTLSLRRATEDSTRSTAR